MMSYMHGDIYVWPDHDTLHIWATKGYIDDHEEEEPREFAATIWLPKETFDELVVMRLAQMSDEERRAAQVRAVQKWSGNGGCVELEEQMKREEEAA